MGSNKEKSSLRLFCNGTSTFMLLIITMISHNLFLKWFVPLMKSVSPAISLTTLKQNSQNIFCERWSYRSHVNSWIQEVLQCLSALLLECSLTDTDQWSSECSFLSELVLDRDDKVFFPFWYVFQRWKANYYFLCTYFGVQTQRNISFPTETFVRCLILTQQMMW